MIPPELVPSFRKNFLVCGLPEQIVDQIAELAEYGACAANEAMVERGQKGSDLYVILEGRVNVLSPQGDKLADAGPGSLVGEVALVDDQPRSADVVAIGLTKYAKLPAQDLRRYMALNKDVGFVMMANLTRVLSMRLRNASVVLEDLKEKASQDPWKFAL